MLPGLLIFSVVFGILSKINMFGADKKGLNVVIAASVALLSLQFNFVTLFFSDIFPRLGVGLSVILAFFILVGLFLPSGPSNANFLLLGVGIITFLVVIGKSFGDFGYGTDLWYYISANLPWILGVVVVIAAVGAVVGARPRTAPAWPAGNSAYYQRQ